MTMQEGYIPFLQYQTYYRIVAQNDADPIILLHGGPGSTHNYFEVLDPVSAVCPVISYDQLGCGNSYVENHTELWTLDTWMRELDNLIASLHLTSFHLLGQSWGGMLAIAYAIEQKPTGLKSLILSSTLPASQLWGEEQHRQIRYLSQEDQDAIAMAEQNGNWTDEAVVEAVNHFMERHCTDLHPSGPACLTRAKKTGKEAYVTAWGPNEFTPTGTLRDFDYTNRLQEITVPTLIVNGTDDLCTPLIAKTMFDRIPNAKWHLFPHTRHMAFVENTEAYIAMLEDWVLNLK